MLEKSAALSLHVKNKLPLSCGKLVSHKGSWCWGVGSGWAGGAVSPLGEMWKPAARVSDINKRPDTTGWNISPKSSVGRRAVGKWLRRRDLTNWLAG